jgi:RND family efflux transporter MFP subunit
MKKIITIVLLSVALGATLIMCSQLNGKEKETTIIPPDESAIAVKLSPVEEAEVSLPVISSGLITTTTEARLSFKIGGYINNIFVKEGETVRKGQLLASLNLTEINAQVVQAKNGFEKSMRDLERGERLFRDSAATLEQVQNLKTASDVNREAYNIAVFNQQHAQIYSTTNGKVIRKLASEGEFIGPGTPVFMLNAANDNEWIIRVGIPDVDWVRIRMGDRAIVTTDAYPDSPLDAEVGLIGEGSDPVTGLYLVEVRIKNNGKKLASGLFGKLEIFPKEKRKLKSIPIESLVEGTGKRAYVFIPNENRVKKVPVEIAFFENDKVFIEKGLDSIDHVINGGSAFLTEYSTVTITK